jgi:hypothetical protein
MTSLNVDVIGGVFCAKRRRFVGIARGGGGSGVTGDQVLSAYPNETHHAALRRMWWWAVVLPLRNQLQSVSFDICLMQFRTYFNKLIIVTSRSRAFCNPPIVFTFRRIFLFLRLYLFADLRRLLLVCFFSASGTFRTFSGGGGVKLFLLVAVFR